MKTQLTNLPKNVAATSIDSGNLVLQGITSPTGTGTVVVKAKSQDGTVIRTVTVTISAANTTYIAEDMYQHQLYDFDTTGMSQDCYAIFTSMRL